VKNTVKLATLLAVVAVGWFQPGFTQQAPKKTPAHPAPAAPAVQPSPSPSPPAADAIATTQSQAGQPGWASRCTSASRDAPLECAIEETAVLTKTGQLIVLVNIRVTGDSRSPVALVQLPLGLNLPAGAKFQVDDGKAVDLPIQTCENRGCYANLQIPADLLAALKSGKQLKVSFQNLGKETITIPMPLTDFTAAYDKIK
jgi:invasion protein IalB